MGNRWRNIWIQSLFFKKKEDMKVYLSNNRNVQKERKNIILQKGGLWGKLENKILENGR